MKVLILLAVVALAAAGDEYNKGNEYKKEVKTVEYGYEKKDYGKGYDKGYDNKQGYGDNKGNPGYGYKNVFHGKYPGKCANDGFYYNNEYSFVICSNGNSYDQKCAPGSKNSGYKNYQYGKDYYYHDFCDVNLVDQGYAARHSGYGYDNERRGYGGGDAYRGDSYRGDGYRGDGYRGDSYRGDGYAYRGDGYRGDGYGPGNNYRYGGYRDGYRGVY